MIRKLSIISLLFVAACQSPSPPQKPSETTQPPLSTPTTTSEAPPQKITPPIASTTPETPVKKIVGHPVTRFNGIAMTINYNITIGEKLTNDQARQISEIIASVFDETHTHYNNWNPSSEISKLNQLPADQIVEISPGLERLFEICTQAYTLSEGRFDPTVDPLVILWKNKLKQRTTPSNQEIAALMPNVGWDKVHISRGRFSKERPGLSIDLCAIAKGYTLDLMTEKLNAAGFPDVFAEWGGEIRATGQHPDKRHWVAGISAIPDLLGDPLAEVNVSNHGLATSGNYQQYWIVSEPSPTDPSKNKQMTFTHIIDPKTGQALSINLNSVTSATVLADSCALADALATAAMIFKNGDDAQTWANRLEEKDPSLKFWIITQNIETLEEDTQF